MAPFPFTRPDEGLRSRDKIFLAALPDEWAAERAWTLGHRRRLHLGWPAYRTPRSCLHVTLGGLGGGMSDALMAALAVAPGRMGLRPFLAEFNRLESWIGEQRPQVLTGEDGVIGFRQLQDALRLILAEAGIRLRWAANFTPHMTLLRGGPEATIEYVAPVRWTVRDFVLVRSHVGQGRYTILGRWPLGPSAPPTACRFQRQWPGIQPP